MADSMRKIINKFLDRLKNKNRIRFTLNDLESYIIETYKSSSKYQEEGGYIGLANELNSFIQEKKIRPIKSSVYNGLNPPLKLKWELVSKEIPDKWDKAMILRYSDLLDFTYYYNNKEFQTERELEYISNIYNFLKVRRSREWASLEERSLELFYDEKFLIEKKDSLKGRHGILKRLKVSYEQLKMKNYGEMFIYWNRGTDLIKNVIILENHSTFFSYKRIAELGEEIFGVSPDVLIYGGGHKIENSFAFIEEIGDISGMKVFYFGDIDSEGLGIYYGLKNRYPAYNISLQKEAYTTLIDMCDREYYRKSDKRNQVYLDFFLEEMDHALSEYIKDKLVQIWNENLRIPQELINYEYLLGVAK